MKAYGVWSRVAPLIFNSTIERGELSTLLLTAPTEQETAPHTTGLDIMENRKVASFCESNYSGVLVVRVCPGHWNWYF